MGCPVFRGSLALDGGLSLPRSDRGPLRGPRCLPHGSARVLALLGDGDRLPREAPPVSGPPMRAVRIFGVGLESLFAPVLTGHSGDSGKDESSAERWDNGRVQTFVFSGAKEARSVASWPEPSVAGSRQPRG